MFHNGKGRPTRVLSTYDFNVLHRFFPFYRQYALFNSDPLSLSLNLITTLYQKQDDAVTFLFFVSFIGHTKLLAFFKCRYLH